MGLFEDFIARGLIKQATNEEKIKDLLDNDKITFYIGFDPTADSLHVGHLLQIITAMRLQRYGHNAILLIGDATASVGDPSGKTDMRKMLSSDDIDINASKISKQIFNLIYNNTIVNNKGSCNFINNSDWFDTVNYLSFIRDIGQHLSVNTMLRADCFKSRMDNGLSFLEFNYMAMQAFDFLQLNTQENCVLQIGGDDQWSNILAGINLIHKKSNRDTFGLTLPLLLNSNGTKMGKTEKGAVWLDKNKTSVFDFFQFWRNLPDADVINCFKLLTFMYVEKIKNIPFNNAEEINNAKMTLATLITTIVHGEDEANAAATQSINLFKNHSFDDMVAINLDPDTNYSVIDLLITAKFAKSKTEARNLIENNGISITDPLDNSKFRIIESPEVLVSRIHFKHFIIKKGKKSFFKFSFIE